MTAARERRKRLKRWNRAVDAIGFCSPILEWYERTMVGLSSGTEAVEHAKRAVRWREKWRGWTRGSVPIALAPSLRGNRP